MFAIVLSLFGGIALSINEENCKAVMRAVMAFGLIAVVVLLTVHLAVQSYEMCLNSVMWCGLRDFFLMKTTFPAHDEVIRFRAYIAAGYSCAFSLFFVLGLPPGPGRERRIKLYPTVGAVALLIGGTISLVKYTGLY